MTTRKKKVMDVLMGNVGFDSLDGEDIKFAATHLPIKDSNETTNQVSVDIDFSSFRFFHNETSFNKSLGVTPKDLIEIEQKLKLAELECTEESGNERPKKSRTLEVILSKLTMKEVIWLIDAGITHIKEKERAQAIRDMLSGMKGGEKGIIEEE